MGTTSPAADGSAAVAAAGSAPAPAPAPSPGAGPRTASGIGVGVGPVVPSGSATVAQRPLPAPGARLADGLLHSWQRRNVQASMPLALRQVAVAGNLDNLRLATQGPAQVAFRERGRGYDSVAAPAGLGYHGPVFMDSDVYKTLEAIGWARESADAGESAEIGEFETFAADAIALLGRVQQDDGYLNSYIQVSGEPRYGTLASSHEMYCAGHLIQAAVALARGSGDAAALGIAVRLADHLVREFAGQRRGLDGHPIIETALVELYRETGTEAYRDLAAQFVDQRGYGLVGDSGFGLRYLQDHAPVRQETTVVGHAVRALYLEAGVTDVAIETGDAELLGSSARRWADMTAAKTYLTGGNGSRHVDEGFGDRFELPPDRAYNETCAAIAAFHWSWRLLLATGEPRYADHMERILYNTFAAAVGTDGDRFFYVNPLQRRADHYEKDDPGRRREWFKTACCPPNIMRLLASLQHYLAAESGDTLYLHQYTSATVAGAGLALEVSTDYPWDGLVSVRVTSAPGDEREIALRIPAWSATAGLAVNGSAEQVSACALSYLRLRRAWRAGDEIRLRLDMTPRWTRPDPRLDAVRGCVAIERGPLVYCFEQTDQPVALDELAVVPGVPLAEHAVTLPGVGRTVQVTMPGGHLSQEAGDAAWSGRPAQATESPSAGQQASLSATAIPYFQWDNRGPGAMRVWIPAATPSGPA
jgi:DUF1680 family protein